MASKPVLDSEPVELAGQESQFESWGPESESSELARFEPLFESMGPIGESNPQDDWLYGILSVRTVVYGSGRIAWAGDGRRRELDHDVLSQCRSLAAKAKANGAGPMASEGGGGYHEFYVAAAIDEPVPERIDEVLIRDRFGGTILPVATVKVQPLDEASPWWSEMRKLIRSTDMDRQPVEGCSLDARLEGALRLARSLADRGQRPSGDEADSGAVRAFFRQLTLNHLLNRAEFRDAAYVEIGDPSEQPPESQWPPSLRGWPSVYPRLFVGLTQSGSLVGLIRAVVLT